MNNSGADIDELKRSQERLECAERDLRLAFDAIPIPAWRARPDGSAEFVNMHFLNYVGLKLPDTLDWGWCAAVHSDDVASLLDTLRHLMADAQSGETEARLRRFDGAYRWFLLRANPVRDASGNVACWYGTHIDIDNLKQAQEHARRSAQDLRDAMDTIPTHAWSVMPDGSDVYLNRRRLDYAGPSGGWETIVHPEDRAEHNRTWAASMKTGESWEVECRLRRADGTYRWFLVRAEPLRDADGRIVRWFGTNTDIDDLHTAQRQLREAERELRATIDTIPAHIWSCLPDGTSDYFNRRRAEYTGAGVDFFGIVHPGDRADHDEKWKTSIRTGRPFEVESRLRRFDGTYRRFLGRAEPLHDDQGNIIRWFGTNTDIENLRRTEEALQQAQAELVHVSRVSTLGELTASIAHEVNQPLAGIVTNGEASLRWLRRERPDLDEAQQAIQRVLREAQRAAEVVNRLRALVRKEEPVRRPLNVNELVEESLPLLAQEVTRQGIKVELSLAPWLPMVLADRVQLQQVLINLLINAIQAMVDTTGSERVLAISSQVSEAANVILVVRDSGPGIDPAAADELFKAFVTTKTNGMGMGLSICKSIIEAHGGRIWANNGEGPGAMRGAIFQFALPVQAYGSATRTCRPV